MASVEVMDILNRAARYLTESNRDFRYKTPASIEQAQIALWKAEGLLFAVQDVPNKSPDELKHYEHLKGEWDIMYGTIYGD